MLRLSTLAIRSVGAAVGAVLLWSALIRVRRGRCGGATQRVHPAESQFSNRYTPPE